MSLIERINLSKWRHVVKLDPDKDLSAAMIKKIAASGTDAVLVGGTQRLTRKKVLSLLWHLRHAPVPVIVEVSDDCCAVPGADGYFVPVVLNTNNPEWFIQRHIKGLERWGALVPWHKVLVEGYIVGNPASTVARQVNVDQEPTESQLQVLVQYGAGLLQLPVIYLEYSGRLADVRLVARAAQTFRRIQLATGATSRLFYGGGIASFEGASAMLKEADTIVIGNALYTPKALDVLEATLAAAKAAGPAYA